MVSNKYFTPDGTARTFLSDVIIKSELYCRVYNFVYDPGGVDGSIDATTGLYVRVNNAPVAADTVTLQYWTLVDNYVSFYTAPKATSTVVLEVATTPEELGDILAGAAADRAETAAGLAETAQAAAEAAQTGAETAETNAAASASAASTSETNAAQSVTDATNAGQLEVWKSEANQKTADSYATEAEDVPVNIYTSNGDGTFTATPTSPAEYSAFHWKQKAAQVGGLAAVVDDTTPQLGGNLDLNGNDIPVSPTQQTALDLKADITYVDTQIAAGASNYATQLKFT